MSLTVLFFEKGLVVLTGRSNVFSALQRPDPSRWEDGAAAVNRVFLSFLHCPWALFSLSCIQVVDRPAGSQGTHMAGLLDRMKLSTAMALTYIPQLLGAESAFPHQHVPRPDF